MTDLIRPISEVWRSLALRGQKARERYEANNPVRPGIEVQLRHFICEVPCGGMCESISWYHRAGLLCEGTPGATIRDLMLAGF